MELPTHWMQSPHGVRQDPSIPYASVKEKRSAEGDAKCPNLKEADLARK